MNGIRALLLILACGFSAAAPAQSFNCRYAKSADEVLICQDKRLGGSTSNWRAYLRGCASSCRRPSRRRSIATRAPG